MISECQLRVPVAVLQQARTFTQSITSTGVGNAVQWFQFNAQPLLRLLK